MAKDGWHIHIDINGFFDVHLNGNGVDKIVPLNGGCADKIAPPPVGQDTIPKPPKEVK